MSYNFLVVDDTNFMRKMAADCLRQYGHVVVGEATNGREAITQYEELQPDIVMMDLTMPEMNGIDAIKEILKIDPSAVILICSASNQQEMIVEALETGAKGYLMKPFKPDRLNEIIRKYAEPHLISKKEKEKEKEEKEQHVTEETKVQSVVQETEEFTRTHYEYTPTIYGSYEDEDDDENNEDIEPELSEEIVKENELVNREPVNSDEAEQVEEEQALETEDIPTLQDEGISTFEDSKVTTVSGEVEEPVLEMESVEMFDVEDDVQAVEYAEVLLAELGTKPEIKPNLEVFLELDQDDEEDVSHPPIVELASKPVNQKTYKFPIGRNNLNLVTSYMCNWHEELNEDVNNYSFVCSEEDNKVTIEMINKNEKQKVELTLDGFRQLFTWMEDRFEEGRKHKAVGTK